MNFFEIILFTILLISYPMLVYSFYLAHNKNIGKEENQLFFDFSLISSFYLVIKFGNDNISSLILLNVILLIAYYKKRTFSIFLISVFLILYYSYVNFLPLSFLLLQYSLISIFYLFWNKKSFTSFVFVFTFLEFLFLLFHQTTFTFLLFLEILSLLVTTLFLLFFLEQAEDILKYHMAMKELEQEKQIRSSLFKITHEIKNPIAVCKGYLDMFDVEDSTHSKKYIPILKEEINRVLFLLEDFLSMKQLQLNVEILDFNVLLEDVLKRYEIILKKNDIKLQFNLIEDEIYMEGDYQRLIQLFINLIKNSMEAMETSKEKKLILSEKIQDQVLTIILEDTGCGMSDEVLKNLGEAFYTTKIKGTGLGVSLSKEIVKAHKGTINYETKEKVGTKVILTLPLYSID